MENAKEFMKIFSGTYAEKEVEWKFFEEQLYTLVSTLVRLGKFEAKLGEQRVAFQGEDFAPIEAALEEQARSLSTTPPTPAEVNGHSLMRELLVCKQKMLEDDEVEVEDTGKLGKCPVSQQSLDALPREQVYRSDACVHHFSKQIYAMFQGGNMQTSCPVPGCRKTIHKKHIQPLA